MKNRCNIKKTICVASLSMLFLAIGGFSGETTKQAVNMNNISIEAVSSLENCEKEFDISSINKILSSFGSMTVYAATPGASSGSWELQADNVTWKYKENNVYATGWHFVNNKWYYMNETGVMQASKWISGLYYVGADGAMLVSSWTPDGYYVGADGAWIPNYQDKEVSAKRAVSNSKTENKVYNSETPKTELSTTGTTQSFLNDMIGTTSASSGTSSGNAMTMKSN